MKTPEEIEALAIQHAKLKPNFDMEDELYYNSTGIKIYDAFKIGYVQCQEDVGKTYTLEDIEKAWLNGFLSDDAKLRSEYIKSIK